MKKYFIADFIDNGERVEVLILARTLCDAEDKFSNSYPNQELIEIFEVRKYDLGRVED